MSDGRQPDGDKSLTRAELAQDFSFILLRTIESVKSDPAQFRNLIYEMARAQLQKEAWHRDPPMNILELRRMMLALETAIERVETETSLRDSIPLLAPDSMEDIFEPEFESATGDGPIALSDQAPVTRSSAPSAVMAAAKSRYAIPLATPLKALLRLGVLAAAAAAIVLVVDREFHVLSGMPPATLQTAATPPQPPPVPAVALVSPPAPAAASGTVSIPTAAPSPQPAPLQPPVHSGPVPSVYGIYAVSDGKLFELEPLAGRVPDLRVFMSAVFNKPTHTLLPDGHVTFIIYRRDIASNTPDLVTVRVIAKVARDLKFENGGAAKTVKVDGAWAIRNVSFDYRVAPSPDSPEMILIKPQDDQFVLAPGRYGLVIKGLAYDFTVDGQVTATAQCLERTEAANGMFYSECRTL